MPEGTTTVAELKRLLDRYPDELEVRVTAPSHDHWGTTLALGIEGCELQAVRWSEHHRTFALPRHPEREPDDHEEFRPAREVLLLR